MNAQSNSLNWFEIPMTDVERARKFYETIFDCKLDYAQMMDMDMLFFPAEPGNGKASGGLVKSNMHTPSAELGPIIYLNGNPDLDNALSKVEAAGGKVLMPKTHISDDIGYMAFFIDSEGNRMALHSQN